MIRSRKIRAWAIHALVALAVIGGLAAPGRANMRPPMKVDGFFSGSIRNLPLSSAVRLRRETILFAFPAFGAGLPPNGAAVTITVRYEMANILAEEIEIPVQFLAVDIQGLTAALDGLTLAVETASNDAEKSECLRRLARHRSDFWGTFYTGFLRRLRDAAGLDSASDADWLSALEGTDLAAVPFDKIYSRTRAWSRVPDFQAAGLRLRLRPGVHVLEIQYAQNLYIDERGYGYGSGWPRKGFSGVDYLLYPALSWPLDPEFRLSVDVDVPEMTVKRLLRKKSVKPFSRSNLPLADVPSGQANVRRLHGDFPGFPADVLTVLVWFDPKALKYTTNWAL